MLHLCFLKQLGKKNTSFEAGSLFRRNLHGAGGFICQHLVWTLQLLSLVPFEDTNDAAFTWSTLQQYCSRQNTLALFKRFWWDFHSGGRPIFLQNSIPLNTADTEHEFIDPIRQRGPDPDSRAARELMVDACKEYLRILSAFETLTFKCR